VSARKSGLHTGRRLTKPLCRAEINHPSAPLAFTCLSRCASAAMQIPSSKLEALRSQLEELLAEHHRVLIFSQFTSFLTYAKNMLDDMGISYAYLDGSTKRRGDVVKEFQEGTAPVFLISLKAGGGGLNLTQADYCIMLDPWWNPAAENQAIDRTHRIGQTNTVMVYRLIAKDTIEEKVMALQQKKRQLFQNVLEDGDVFSVAITEDDIRRIFD
jgi:SNF2 family DNA or RNA helicase